jgi:hypothetical protein
MFADTDRHFRKLSIRKMQFQVTDIHFDFGDSFEPIITKEEMDEIVDETFSTIWEAVDEEDLVEEITAATGFSVNSINYQHVLK